MKSPIKYYGSKTAMTDIILNHFPSDFDIYCEGFGGGGSVLFAKEPNKIEIYNDIDDCVYNFFNVLSGDKYNEFVKRISLLGYHRKIHDDFINKQNNNEYKDDVDKAVCFFYLNRCKFQGNGAFHIAKVARRNMAKSVAAYLSVVDGLYEFHERLTRVGFENKDIFEFIEKYDSNKTFFYLDPPYVISTRVAKNVYKYEMNEGEHKRLCETLLNIKGKCLISGYDNDIYNNLTNEGFFKYSFKSVSALSNKTETLWWNYELKNKSNCDEEKLFI